MFVTCQTMVPGRSALSSNRYIVFSELPLKIGDTVRFHTYYGFLIGFVTELNPEITIRDIPIFDVFELIPPSVISPKLSDIR